MKQILALIGLLAVAFSPAYGQPTSVLDTGYPPDIQRILDRGALVVAMYHQDIPPFMMHDKNGAFVGHDVALARDIAEKLGVAVQFNRSPRTFDGIIETVARHEADLAISLISITLARARKVRFSDPYLILHPTLVVNRVNASNYAFDPADPLKAIAGTAKTIGEKAGTSYVGFARNMFKNALVKEFKTWDQAMMAVYTGEVFAALRDEIGVKNMILQSPQLAVNLQMMVIPDRKDPLGIAVPTDSPHLLDWINLYLEKHHPTLTADELLEQYAHLYKRKGAK